MGIRRKRTTRKRKNQPGKYDKIIGPYTNHTSPEKGNGVKLANVFKQHYIIPMNTWEREKIHIREKQEIKKTMNQNKSKQTSGKETP